MLSRIRLMCSTAQGRAAIIAKVSAFFSRVIITPYKVGSELPTKLRGTRGRRRLSVIGYRVRGTRS